MGCFPFLFVGVLYVPSSSSSSSALEFGCPIMSSIYTSSCCTNPTIGCDTSPSYFVLSLSTPLIWWANLTLGCFLNVSDIEGFCSFTRIYRSISILIVAWAFPSSSITVELTGSSCGEGMAWTSTTPSRFLWTCSSHIGSCTDLVVLRVFLSSCLSAPNSYLWWVLTFTLFAVGALYQ